MSAAIVRVIIESFRCEVESCGSTVNAREDVKNEDVLWHKPMSTEFFSAGWVHKVGHSRSLTYCPKHVLRAVRCTCSVYGVKDSCARHSPTAVIRGSASALAAYADLNLACTPVDTHGSDGC